MFKSRTRTAQGYRIAGEQTFYEKHKEGVIATISCVVLALVCTAVLLLTHNI